MPLQSCISLNHPVGAAINLSPSFCGISNEIYFTPTVTYCLPPRKISARHITLYASCHRSNFGLLLIMSRLLYGCCVFFASPHVTDVFPTAAAISRALFLALMGECGARTLGGIFPTRLTHTETWFIAAPLSHSLRSAFLPVHVRKWKLIVYGDT